MPTPSARFLKNIGGKHSMNMIGLKPFEGIPSRRILKISRRSLMECMSKHCGFSQNPHLQVRNQSKFHFRTLSLIALAQNIQLLFSSKIQNKHHAWFWARKFAIQRVNCCNFGERKKSEMPSLENVEIKVQSDVTFLKKVDWKWVFKTWAALNLLLTSRVHNSEPPQNFVNTIHCGAKFWASFVFRRPNLKIQNEIVFSQPDSKSKIISDSSYDQ